MATTLAEGDQAPAFELPTDDGGTVSTATLAGRPYVLYFYPKDDTPGCTTEAKGFAEAYPRFADLGVEVIGVSKDTISSHQKFRQKHGLCFPLAAADASDVVEKFDAWVEKNMYGKKSMGVERSTFLVGADGKIARAWRQVKVDGHVEAVLDAARQLAGR
jgi:peroxiredoxin Q/BCP